MTNNPKFIVIHCSDVSYKASRDQLLSINNYHQSREFPISRLGWFVGYHNLITNGHNYQCRLPSEEGAHTNQKVDDVSVNLQSLGICVGFDGDVEYPHPDDYPLLQKQVWEWQDWYNIDNEHVFYHRHFNTEKSCPGSLLQDDWLKNLLNSSPLPKPDTQEEKQKDILKAKVTLLQRLLAALLKLKQLT